MGVIPRKEWCIMLVFTYDKTGLPIRGTSNLAGESSSALLARAKREAKEGETTSAVYSRFSSIPAIVLAKAWQSAQARKRSTLEACDDLGIDPAYVDAWRSACLAVRPDAKSLPSVASAADSAAAATKDLTF